MKDLLKSVLSNLHWILIFSTIIGFTIFLHHMFMSGVNPIISNAFVFLIITFFIVTPVVILSKVKTWNLKSIINLIVSALITITLGLLIGKMIMITLHFG
jgi:hypothetical protein